MTARDAWLEVDVAGSPRPALIDARDESIVASIPGAWRLVNGYARTEARTGGGRLVTYMHRLIAAPPVGFEVDHINRDRLDNRRANLRNAVRRQNCGNQGRRSDNTSGYRGVSRARSGRWVAHIRVHGRSVHLGTFDRPEDAARAYDRAATEVFGAFACLNVPEAS